MSGIKSMEIFFFSNYISGFQFSCCPAPPCSAQEGHLEVTPGSTGDSAMPSTAVGRENEQITDLQIPRESQNHFSWERAQGPVSPAMNLSVPSALGAALPPQQDTAFLSDQRITALCWEQVQLHTSVVQSMAT